eukprot:CAMPEP_0198200444 /NCGR_PEP_ID=MMETSP1445-20131203/3452_1 /TAXON_ID=36898 /ORGANISM="Pyramimonas sp., Strain CCMP2087" /LENGTH=156 /DNA_ID=CAMNT_0043870515 /DNA_START=374 /DNA_END=844 /DNA_ORIENTATION=-
MTPNPATLNLNDPLRDAVRAFLNEEVSGFPVVDDEQKLVGVISLSDILWYEALYDDEDIKEASSEAEQAHYETAAKNNKHIMAGKVRDSMNSPAIFTTPEVLVSTAARIMLTNKIDRLPVVAKQGPEDGKSRPKEGTVVGIITRADIMRCMASALV